MYFQEYARSIFEIEENKVEKGVKDTEKEEKDGEKVGEKGGKGEKENEYQQVLEGTSSDEKSVSLSMELELNSRIKSDDKGTIIILNENKSIINIKYNEVKERSEGIDCRKSKEDIKGKGSCEDGTDVKYEKDVNDGRECTEKKEQLKGEQEQDEEGNIVEHSPEVITPHQWQHFEPFFKWLDNPDKLPEVRWGYRVD